MGQQPNIELDGADAPRTTLQPGVPDRWKPDRPGEINSPEDMRWGGAFGRPGPDTGWAIRLIRRAEYDRSNRPKETDKMLGAVVGARASLIGRAPTPGDVEVALTLMGLRPDGLPSPVVAELSGARERWLDASAHEHTRGAGFVASIPTERLLATPAELRVLLAG
ncbi:MAG: hypothetical protein OEO77_06550 [Acidimicrobiia bacterium]|nr:hypothetical protein [Acidimicrobiia bacterium]